VDQARPLLGNIENAAEQTTRPNTKNHQPVFATASATSFPDAADRRQLTNSGVVVASQFSSFQLRFEFHEILRTVVLWLAASFPAFSFVLSFMVFPFLTALSQWC